MILFAAFHFVNQVAKH